MNNVIKKQILKAKLIYHRTKIDNAALAFAEGKISERKRNAITKKHTLIFEECRFRYLDLAWQSKLK